MQDMLAKIIAMDENARKIKEEAEQNKIKSEKEIEELREKIYSDYIERAKERIEKNIAVDREYAEKSLSEYTEKVELAEKDMQALYRNNGDRWIDEIVSRVLA
ncbi:MAG: hypothetical protein IJS27_04625 [Ruminococcus sp.]|nr:hypothetical protein [Ruminococcus sp.]MBQ9515610.1 hypothetical protein [Ruminococcus sp.]